MRNGYKFSITPRNLEELQRYRVESDSVLSFLRDCCETGESAAYVVGSAELFQAYKSYCEEAGMKPYAQNKFSNQVQAACPGAKRGTDKLGRKRIMKGIRLGEILA